MFKNNSVYFNKTLRREKESKSNVVVSIQEPLIMRERLRMLFG